jgi:hypothetical protein
MITTAIRGSFSGFGRKPSDGRVVAHRAGEEFRDASITAKRSDPDNLLLKVNVCFIIMLAVVALFC